MGVGMQLVAPMAWASLFPAIWNGRCFVGNVGKYSGDRSLGINLTFRDWQQSIACLVVIISYTVASAFWRGARVVEWVSLLMS